MRYLKQHYSALRRFMNEGFLLDFYRSSLLFFFAGVVIYLLGLLFPSVTEELVYSFQQMILDKGVIDEMGNVSAVGLFINNWSAAFLSILYGFLPFVFLPLFPLLLNGGMLGVMAAWYELAGQSMGLFLVGILPHGVFELPAICMACALGLRLCLLLCRKLLRRKTECSVTQYLADALRCALLLILPLLLLAAVVEAYLTPVLMMLAA